MPFSIGDWARCLADFLDAVGVARAYIGGLSWGGVLAQELYRLDPARVATLVLDDTYAGWRGSFGPEVAAQRLKRCEGESTLDAEEFVRLWVPQEFFTETVSDAACEQMAAVVRDFHPVGFRLMARSLADTIRPSCYRPSRCRSCSSGAMAICAVRSASRCTSTTRFPGPSSQ